MNNSTAQGRLQEQGKHQGVLPWRTIHNLRTSWASGIIFVFSCLWWTFFRQAYLLFIVTLLPASASRCSPCFCIAGRHKVSFPLYLLLGALECIDFLLPCSQLKRIDVFFCQSHLSIPHFTKHHSPSFSHNSRAMFLCGLLCISVIVKGLSS